MGTRMLFVATLAFFGLFGPWWLFAGLIIAGAFLFSRPYEILFIAFFHDALYGISEGGERWFFLNGALMTVIAFVSLFIGSVFHGNVRGSRYRIESDSL